MNEKDREYMARAIGLAARGEGFTAPNPMVGAVIVRDGSILGEGYHQRCGELHAERNALEAVRRNMGGKLAAQALRGSTLYVTLEPCCHQGKTPPCTEAILEAGIGRVVIGSRDPNPKVAGRGVAILRGAGVAVEEDFMREECDRLNPVFFRYITTGLPYVVMKYAMTADGKIAAVSGVSRWITGEAAREDVQRLRHMYSGIMAGIGTVLQDDPLLTCRLPGGKNPVRIICDSRLRIPEDSQICRSALETQTIVATLERNGGVPPVGGQEREERRRAKMDRLKAMGVQVLEIRGRDTGGGSFGKPGGPAASAGIDLTALMQRLGAQGVDSVLLEGGGTLNYSMLSAGLVQRVYAYIAPKVFGGAGARTPVGGAGALLPSEAFLLSEPQIRLFDGDVRLEYEVRAGGKRS